MNRRISRYLLIVASMLIIAPIASAQCVQSLQEAVKTYQDETAKGTASNALVRKLSFESSNTPCLVVAVLSNPTYQQSLLTRVAATFQQSGASSGTAGSTNIVSKGAAAKVLSLATEYGALTESVSGQTVTLSGTLAGIPTLLEALNAALPCTPVSSPPNCISLNLQNKLSRFSYSVAFDASQASPQVSANSAASASTQPTTFTANYHSISAVTAKAVLLKGASAKPADITKAVSKIPQIGAEALDKLLADLEKAGQAQTGLDKLFADNNPNMKAWAAAEIQKLRNATPDQVATEYASWSQSLPQALCPNGILGCILQTKAEDYAKAYFAFVKSQNTFIEGLRANPMITAEYDANLPASQTSNSTVRLIAGIPLFHKGLTVTANGAVSFYNSNPSTTVPGARQLRDFQLAAESAYTFGSGSASILGQSTASLAYYYQDQTSPGILNVTPGQSVSGVTFTGLPSTATQIFAKRGVINLMQMKFNYIPGKGSINVPLSITWSNRTELVTQPVWRTQIGVSYNFDSLLSLVGK